MAAPPLRIPLGLNMAEFEKGIESAKSHTRQATQFILKQFVDMNASLGGPAAAGLFAGYGVAALRLVGIFGAVVTAAKLTGEAIAATRARLVEMVETADKAADRGLSPEFLQSFTAVAKGAEDRIALLETALDRAFQATKPLLNPDWSVWDQGITKVSAVEKAMRETRELFTTDQDFSGFDLFKNAKDQDQKIKAVLIYMQQLKAIGQEVAALDIGEKMFGSKFADELRLGKESVDNILKTIDTGSKSNFISNDAAKNAKELDDRLNDAWHTISEKMKPDWDDLANVALRIKGIWTDLIQAVAEYKAAAATARPVAGANSTPEEAARNNPDPNSAAFANPRLLNQGRRRRGQGPDAIAGSSGDESAGLNMGRWQQPEATAESVPLPRRRPQDAPPPPATTMAQRDPFEMTVDQINKRIAALKAETETIDLSAAAQMRAKTVAQLEEAAKRANTAAGLKNTEVTAAQRKEIEKEADAMLAAAAAAEKAKVASSIRVGQGTAFLTQEDVAIAQQLRGIYGNDIPAALNSSEAAAMRLINVNREIGSAISSNLTTALADAVDGTKTAGQAFADFSKVVIRAMEEAIIKIAIVGPLMRSLQGGLGFLGFADGGVVPSGTIQVGNQSFPSFATGGQISGPGTGKSDSILARVSNGEFIVNADATSRNRRLLEAINNGLPGFADGGFVGSIPDVARPAAAGGISVVVQSNPVFQAGMTPTDMAQIKTMLAVNSQQTTAATIDAIRRGQRATSTFLG